ncbi:hypothetical protein CPL00134L_CDS0050 [Escherichia phage Phagiculus]
MIQTIRVDNVKVGDEVIFTNCPPQKVKSIELNHYPTVTFVMIKTQGGNSFPIKSETLVCINR